MWAVLLIGPFRLVALCGRDAPDVEHHERAGALARVGAKEIVRRRRKTEVFLNGRLNMSCARVGTLEFAA
jgi:hypothetical protein